MISYKDTGKETLEGFELGEAVIFKGTNKLVRIIGILTNGIGKYNFLITCDTALMTFGEIKFKYHRNDANNNLVLSKGYLDEVRVLFVSKDDIEHQKNKNMVNLPYIPSYSQSIINKTDDASIQALEEFEKYKDNKSEVEKTVKFAPSSHYVFGDGLNCMDFIKEAVKECKGIEGFYLGNAIKYLFRTNKKNGVDDLKKAHNYITLLLKLKGVEL